MLKINDIETFLVDLPTIRPHVLSMATMHRQTVVLVRIISFDFALPHAVEGVPSTLIDRPRAAA